MADATADVPPTGVTVTTDTTVTPTDPTAGVRVRLVTMLAWALIMTVLIDATLGFLAVRAPETFKNWDLITKILDGNGQAKTALIAGLLGFMARDAVMK